MHVDISMQVATRVADERGSVLGHEVRGGGRKWRGKQGSRGGGRGEGHARLFSSILLLRLATLSDLMIALTPRQPG